MTTIGARRVAIDIALRVIAGLFGAVEIFSAMFIGISKDASITEFGFVVPAIAFFLGALAPRRPSRSSFRILLVTAYSLGIAAYAAILVGGLLPSFGYSGLATAYQLTAIGVLVLLLLRIFQK